MGPVNSEEQEERKIHSSLKQIYHVPHFLAPFGQAVKLETADVGIFFRGKSAFVHMLRS